MLDFLNKNIPKALLPLTVVLIGFVIVAVSLFVTRFLVKMIERFRKNDKKDGID